MLGKGVDVQDHGSYRVVDPLEMAARAGYPNIVQELLKKKARPGISSLELSLHRTFSFDPYFRIENKLMDSGLSLSIEGPKLLEGLINFDSSRNVERATEQQSHKVCT